MALNIILTVVLIFVLDWLKNRFYRKRIRRELHIALMFGPMDKLEERVEKVLTKYYGPKT